MRCHRSGSTMVQAIKRDILITRRRTNGPSTSVAPTFNRLKLRACLMSMLSLQILLNKALKTIQKPIGSNQTQLVHAISQPLCDAILSSMPKGKIADPIVIVPTHVMTRKPGCDALTTRLSRHT
mmetsp:Transcript_632/g.1853  ORF Transcript_632/g.1853 Transcript_632/m.1853 type:complete len:124 (-) Transcript_632:835-1206(-)